MSEGVSTGGNHPMQDQFEAGSSYPVYALVIGEGALHVASSRH